MQERVNEFLMKMAPGSWFEVKKISKKKPTEFVCCVRNFISLSVDHWRYEISDDNEFVLRNNSLAEESFNDWLNNGAKKPSVFRH